LCDLNVSIQALVGKKTCSIRAQPVLSIARAILTDLQDNKWLLMSVADPVDTCTANRSCATFVSWVAKEQTRGTFDQQPAPCPWLPPLIADLCDTLAKKAGPRWELSLSCSADGLTWISNTCLQCGHPLPGIDIIQAHVKLFGEVCHPTHK
jgi:hypothetical protein